MKLLLQPYFLSLFLLAPFLAVSQIPSIVIDIEGRIIEQTSEGRKGLSDVEIWVMDQQDKTDEQGKFSFKVPLRKDHENAKLDVRPLGYKILKPLNGELNLNAEMSVLYLEIFVINEKENTEFKRKVEELEKKLIKTAQQHRFTQKRLNRINQIMIDTLAYYQEKENSLKEQIDRLKVRNYDITTENQGLKEQIKQLEQDLDASIKREAKTREQLYQALEEKYLRQQQLFNNISADLNDYLIHAKDMQEVFTKIRMYYPMNYSKEGDKLYNEKLNNYSDVIIRLNRQIPAYLEGVEHEWESPAVARQLEATFDVVFKKLHFAKVKPIVETLQVEIKKNKKRAAKTGAEAAMTLSPIIAKLEQSINQTIADLKENL